MAFKATMTGNSAYQAQMKGDNQKAKELYEAAMAEGLDKINLIDAYGVLLMKEGEFQKSIDIFGKALNLKPALNQRYEIRIHRSIAYLKSGDTERAKVALEDIIRNHQTIGMYETLGYLYIITDDEKAREFNEEAINLYDDNPTILDNIGQYYLDKGHPEIAKEFLEDAYEIDAKKVDVNFHLARVALSEGDKKKALDYANNAKECVITALNDTKPEDIENFINELLG